MLARATAATMLALLLPAAARSCALTEAEPVEIAAVVDARTLEAGDGRLFRPAGIESFAALGDGPEADMALREEMTRLVSNSAMKVQVLERKTDRYGRLPVLLAGPGGRLVQQALAATGAAVAYPERIELPCFDEILAAEDAARRWRAGAWASRDRLPRARPEALRPFVDRFAIFEGRVATVGNREWRTYLNFGGLWSEDVTVTIEAKDRGKFGGEAALAALAGREVRIRGHVSERGGPLTVIHSPHQLELIGPEDESAESAP